MDELRRRGAELTNVEVKSGAGGVPSSLLDTLSAFSNGRGGTILLGLDDSFTAVPIDAEALRDGLAGMAADRMSPPVRGDIDIDVIDGGHRIVRFDVPEAQLGDKPCFVESRGRYQGSYIRGGDGDRRLTDYEIDRLIENRSQPLHDRDVVAGATVDAFDQRLLVPFLERLRGSRPRAFDGRSDDEMLRSLGIASLVGDRLAPTVAGLLVFGRYPQEFFPQLFVSVVVLPGVQMGDLGPGGERFIDNRTIEGPLPVMAAEVVTTLTRHMTRSAVMHGAYRDERLEYPVEVVRELVVNALMHRDYSSQARGAQVQVELYPDRLVVRSPGGFFGAVDPADLGAPDVSSSRNALLAKLLADAPMPGSSFMMAENRGSGIPTVLRVLNRAGMAPPRFRADLRKVEVVVPHHALLTPDIVEWIHSLGQRDLSDPQVQALALLRVGGELRNQTLQGWGLHSTDATRELADLVQRGLAIKVGDRRGASYRLPIEAQAAKRLSATPPPSSAVPTDRQQAILALFRAEGMLSTSAIERAMSVSRATAMNDINALLRAGLLEATAPLKSRRRAYRLSTTDEVPSVRHLASAREEDR
ncbi:MAG: putative DNA binding domain-containing protein [Austwickia sp.]|nr:putative DNA binding domain-containing protein [Actinomycetota bacterium]MCB1254141.1 putative DNA binding domain-containing protein [Austwickia sp.]